LNYLYFEYLGSCRKVAKTWPSDHVPPGVFYVGMYHLVSEEHNLLKCTVLKITLAHKRISNIRITLE